MVVKQTRFGRWTGMLGPLVVGGGVSSFGAVAVACPGQVFDLNIEDPQPPSCGDALCQNDAAFVREYPQVCAVDVTFDTSAGACVTRLMYPTDGDGWPDNGPATFPLVAHGHGAGFDHDQYDYLQQLLASNGIVTVSINLPLADGSPENVPPSAAYELACLERLYAGQPQTQWLAEDAARLNDILGLSGHSMGGAIAWWASATIAEDALAYDVRAVALTAPRRPGGDEETAPLSTLLHAQAPAVLVISAGQDNDVPDDSHPYHGRTAGESSYAGPTDLVPTTTLVHLYEATHAAFAKPNTIRGVGARQRRLAAAMYLAFFDTYIFGRSRFKDRLTGQTVDPSVDASPTNMTYWVSFHQGSRTALGGELSDVGSRQILANFEPGDVQEGSWSVPDGDLDVVQASLDTLNIGRSWFNGPLGDQATCTQQFSGAFSCENPMCDACQSYANRHRLGDVSSSGLRVRWSDAAPGDRKLWVYVPAGSQDISKRQFFSLEISTAYLDALNGGQGHDVRFALRDGSGATTAPMLLSSFATKTAGGDASIAAPGMVRYPSINQVIPAGGSGMQDLTSAYFRTYRVPLHGQCDDGIDPTNITQVQLEFVEASGSMLLDELSFEWSPDEPGTPACDGSLVEGEDPNAGGDDGGEETSAGTGTGDEAGGLGDGGGGCQCSAHRRGVGGFGLLPGVGLGLMLFGRRRSSHAHYQYQ